MTTLTLVLILSMGENSLAQLPTIEPPPAQAAAADDVVLRWNQIALALVRTDKTPPPLVGRNLAMMHLAMYDAVNTIVRTHRPYLTDLTAEADAVPEAAAIAAAHRILFDLYPRQREFLDDHFIRSAREFPESEGRRHGLELGQAVAERMLNWRAKDLTARANRYSPKMGLGYWQPTPPAFREALLPDWGYVDPFGIKPGTQHCPKGPPALDSPEYARAFDEVKALGRRDSPYRTEDQTAIARFWADDVGTSTPPGHWNHIAYSVSRQRGLSMHENARLFALLNMALADAGILCWVHKFTYEFWRPVTGIQLAAEDGNPQTLPDPDWMPLLDTPPFPAYISGHSTFSGAASSTLARFFESDEIPFETISESLPGMRRPFRSFRAAAEEAGMSRIYGGIHWQFDNTDGLEVGRTIGAYIMRQHLTPVAPGTCPPRVQFERNAAYRPEAPSISRQRGL